MKDLEIEKSYYIDSSTEDCHLEELYKWLLDNDKDWGIFELEDFNRYFENNYLTYDGEEWTFVEETEFETVPVESLFSKRNGWYTYGNKGKGNWLMYHDFTKNKVYGFCEYDGSWFENSYVVSLDGDSILASKESVEERLIKEAEKRGFKGTFEYDHAYNEFWCDGTVILSDGVWTEPTHDNLKPLIEEVPSVWSKSLRGEELKPQYFQMAGRREGINCYYFYHSEKHGPNFYTKEELPFHDGEDWKEDLVVYTQLGSGKKFVTTKERFKKFKEVWI